MNVVIVIVAGVCALALATPTPKIDSRHDFKIAGKEWLEKELKILNLFKYVHQPSYYKEYIKVADSFKMDKFFDWYKKPEAAKELWFYYQRGMLPKGEIFSPFHQEHLKEAIALFKVFYYAKNWEAFWRTAVWARQNVNEGQFFYALSVALVHRQDTQELVLPPIYEIHPHFFFPSEVIQKAQEYKQKYYGLHKHEQATRGKGYTVYANYSGWYLNLHPEQSLSYFTEDVGVNSFYFYYNLYYPFWMDSKEFEIKNNHRGEQFYYIHQQLLARYYLERLSNGFGEIPYFDWEYPIETGFYPSLQYPNGLKFPSRPSNVELHKKFTDGHQSHAFYSQNYTWAYTLVQDYEKRIRDAIDLGFVWTSDGQKVNLFDEHGFEVLGDLIESNPDSPNSRFYGALQVFARYLLGYSYLPLGKYQVAPSVLEIFSTSLRDPVFYQFYKRLVTYFQKYKSYLPAYKYDELYFPGVKVEGVEFDQLVTYFDYFYSDVTNAVYLTEKEFLEGLFKVRVGQERLNFKPFTYKVQVSSEKPAEAIVRVFIGPKYDEYGRVLNITYNRLNFVEFDRFIYKLKAGKNVIERNSYDNWYAHDYVSYEKMFTGIKDALEGKQEYHLYQHDYYYGFPTRFLLPKGSEKGLTYQFYFMVSQYKPQKLDVSETEWYWPVGFEHKYVDEYAYGYPFDRPIYDELKFQVPNSFFYETPIYHQDVQQINAPHL